MFLSPSGSTASQPVPGYSQQDVYISLKNLHCGRSPATSIRSRPNSPSLICTRPVDPDCMYGSVSGLSSARTSLTPPIARRSNYNPSPAGPRKNWIQRHNRRPNTVNIDENTMSGNCNSNITKGDPNPPQNMLHNILTNYNMIYSPASVPSHAVDANTCETQIPVNVGCR